MQLSEYLPASLQAPGPSGLALWQWLALPVVAALAAIAGALLERVTRAGLGLVARRTHITIDDRLLELSRGPSRCLWALLAAYLLLGELHLPDGAHALLGRGLRTAAFVAFFWLLLRLVVLAGQGLQASAWATTHPSLRSLVPLGVRIGRIAVAAIAVVAVLADLGYPVSSLVAGLGIGGLAVALAAQKTVENLFGAFAMGVDQPFAVGDTIRVDGVEGVVEAIGLRSTRIRTADRTVVSLPNGKLADMRIESLTARDRLRLSCVLALHHATSAAQLRAVLAGAEALLRAHPKTRQEDVVVRLREIGSQALEVEVLAWFETTDFGELRGIREQVLLGFMEVVERAGAAFASPGAPPPRP